MRAHTQTRVSVQTPMFSQFFHSATDFSQADDVAVSTVGGIYSCVLGQLPVCY